jgi:hypothetical protein
MILALWTVKGPGLAAFEEAMLEYLHHVTEDTAPHRKNEEMI